MSLEHDVDFKENVVLQLIQDKNYNYLVEQHSKLNDVLNNIILSKIEMIPNSQFQQTSAQIGTLSDTDTLNTYAANITNEFLWHNNIQLVIDNNGKFFIFCGYNYTGYNNNIVVMYNDMNIFDTTTTTLSISYIVSTSQIGYIATLSPSGIIIHIGGDDNLTSIQIFDAKTYNWSTKMAVDAFIKDCNGHLAVLSIFTEI
ncbi:galactose oxidase [Gigaspora margarita]|uniref:Galactose oxidase n=1 Tax=Gigaspora margarita TaxID=4874 RepID=A0A8H4A8Q8_GIGMA|nr:galactose oxidase [Gigaspora margarita]